MWIIGILVIIALFISVVILYCENADKNQTILRLRKGSKKSKNTYILMYDKLERRNERIKRLEKQIVIGAIGTPVR